jgi:hypothetical protein
VAGTNNPGGRLNATYWTDSSGNFWLFGGYGYDSAGTLNTMNDLWEFKSSVGSWVWISGSNIAAGTATYGTQGTGATTNIPGARMGAAGWADSSGNLWLFGGSSYWLFGKELYSTFSTHTAMNDLWEFTPSNGNWTWVGGSQSTNSTGVYGTEGYPASTNTPGARDGGASTWVDSTGNFWLFGGEGYDSTGTNGSTSDLWVYQP